MAADLFSSKATKDSYTAKDIEVLEGLEPVRRRPGMYIGGTDERALHHLVAEVLDNAMDEAVAGHASRIEVTVEADNVVTIADNGRGIPIDPHPKFKNKSALEVILTTLHSGGKFSDKAYQTAGGLHGVGISVVNALSDKLTVEVARDKKLFAQSYSRGKPTGPLKPKGPANRRGTTVTFHPDPDIFGKAASFRPLTIFRMVRAKAFLFRGVEIRWKCDPGLLKPDDTVPQEAVLHFPGGLADSLTETIGTRPPVTAAFVGEATLPGKEGRLEWAVAWMADEEGESHSYCNTVPTPQGGSHEAGLRGGLARALRGYGERIGNRKIGTVTQEDVCDGAVVFLSLFIKDPQFQGQTKERLGMPDAQRLVDASIKDHFDHWLSDTPEAAAALVEHVVQRAEERVRRRQEKDLARKSATRKLRLPGKLADCARQAAEGTEIFLVEGDSAGGSAKQARNRETQAILPLRGKILNVASASADKLRANQELSDLVQALGCGTGASFAEDKLRYERVIIMTDADVDGAHIASLLMTFFYREMPALITSGHLFLAMPPLYRLAAGGEVRYARDDRHREELLATVFKGKGKVETSRFKGLGEMPPGQLKETTMDPARRVLLRVEVPEAPENKATESLVERLMGRKPELRLEFIQENAQLVRDLDV
ncbi:MAG: DNA topoisomerase IV subunit B [Alphaproteobacteria bacterium]|nr:DNA topoisomerase IV subunit B [Alphaproteobacteria bacterium]